MIRPVRLWNAAHLRCGRGWEIAAVLPPESWRGRAHRVGACFGGRNDQTYAALVKPLGSGFTRVST